MVMRAFSTRYLIFNFAAGMSYSVAILCCDAIELLFPMNASPGCLRIFTHHDGSSSIAHTSVPYKPAIDGQDPIESRSSEPPLHIHACFPARGKWSDAWGKRETTAPTHTHTRKDESELADSLVDR